jgi:membrane protease YdiL (CAAX protease family)
VSDFLPPIPDSDIVQARPVAVPPLTPLEPPSPLELRSLQRWDAGLDLALVLLVAVFVPFGFEIAILPWLEGPALVAGDLSMLIVRKCFDVLLGVGLLAYLLLRHRLPATSFGVRLSDPLPQVGWTGLGVVMTYGWLLFTVAAVTAWMAMQPQVEEDVQQRLELLEQMPVNSIGLTILLLIPVAIHEEIIFRGLLLPLLRRACGSWAWAVILSSTLFAALHFAQGLVGVLQIGGVGVVLALCFVRSRSLLVVIAAHFLFNFLQFQLIRWVQSVQSVY